MATEHTDQKAAAAMEEVRTALQEPYVALHFVQTFTHGRAVQVKIKTRKVGPLLLPPEGGTVGDVLRMLGAMADE